MRATILPYSRLAKHFSPFFRAWVEGDVRAKGFLPAAPFDFEAIRAHAVERLSGTYPRREIADALSRHHRQLESPEPVLARIDALRANDTVCVVAGQQPVIGGGPLFIILKALTVLALAREVESRHGFRCVPLFWNHSDDHDLAEVDRLGVPGPDGALRTLRAELPDERRPVADVEDEERMERFRKTLAQALPEGPGRAEAIALVRDTAAPGPAAWFTRLLTRLFGAEGLVVFEPRWLAREAAPVLARVVDAPNLIPESLDAGGRALKAAGFPRPLGPAGTGLFLIHDGARSRLDADGHGFVLADGTTGFTPGRVRQLLDQSPKRLSAGVALRPALQESLFPAVAVVAGPNEAAYLAQLGPLYAALGVSRAPVVPRASATLVDAESAAALVACGAPLDAVLRDESIPPPLPPGLAPAFEAARHELGGALDRLRASTAGAGAGIEANFHKTRERILESIAIYAQKAAEAADRAEGVGLKRAELLRARLLPGGELQERAVAWMHFTALGGTGLFQRLGGALDFTAAGHQVVFDALSPG